MTRYIAALAIAAALLASCTTSGDDPADDDPADDDPVATTGEDAAADDPSQADDTGDADDDEPPPPPCRIDELTVEPLELTGADDVEVAISVAQRTHRCAPVAVVAGDDPWVASLAAVVAHAADAPLLLTTATAPAAIEPALARLEAEELVAVGVELADVGLPGTELLAPSTPPTADDTGGAQPDDPGADPDAGPAPPATGAGATTAPDDPPSTGHLDLALRVAEHLDTDRFLAVAEADLEARAAALARLSGDIALLPLPDDLASVAAGLPPTAEVEVLASDDGARGLADRLIDLGVDADVVPGRDTTGADDASDPDDESDLDDPWAPALDVATSAGITWLADPADGAATAVAAVAAAGRGEALLPVNGQDLRADRARTQRLRSVDPGSVAVVGQVTDDADWQLATVLEGEPLPNGGFRLFENERIVALYGSVETSALGVLGEQGLDATVDRVRTVAEPYGADGVRVLPTFEIITTIASASEEPTGDYSRRTSIDRLRPWIDRAAEEGIYVFLDLQPGRTDFLTQAMEYEELLREPHVGLALDPEWRLAPDEFHLRQIGSVAAEEVQEVADWLAELTREARLPEKLLVLHQFRFSMLPDRDTIVAPPELAVVVHMDGQGALAAKYETYAAITGGVEDRWLWGWKNFYDEDVPTATPAQVLDVDPLPVLVTYQ